MENLHNKVIPKIDANKLKNLEFEENINTNSKFVQILKIIFSVFLYFLMLLLILYVVKYNDSFNLIIFGFTIKGTIFNAIISQMQVMICIYLVVSEINKGFLISIILNGCSIVSACISIFIFENIHALHIIFTSICTLIIIKIINIYNNRLKQAMVEMKRQNEELRENEMKQSHLKFYDVLTNLPNRTMIIDKLNYLINLSKRERISFAIVLIDLDNFKKINDITGHFSGDLLLQAVADKLNEQIHHKDILGRIGGDEFALVIQRELSEKLILQYVEKLRALLLDSFMVNNIKLNVSASFGISIYPQDGYDASELLKFADTALHKAKDYGKNCIQFFNKAMNDEIISKIELENNLRTAIQKNELFLVFQPQYSSLSKQLRGFEVLVRWDSAKLGLLTPNKFIPIAEESGYIVTMGEWILRAACEKLKYIQDTFSVNVIMSVNISAIQLMDPNFLHVVESIIDETKVNGNNLEFEITESIFISSIEYVVCILHDLREMGISIALDDFGTGYSSLNYLQMLPIDTLKIDKSFIDKIKKNSTQKHFVSSIISLAHQIGITIVAEGVENEIQVEYLKNHTCDYIQGYLWGKPLNKEELNSLLKDYIG